MPDELIPEDEEPEFVDTSVEEEDTFVEAPIAAPEVAPPPPSPPPVEPEEIIPEIINIAEQMPRFPGCEGIAGSRAEKNACAQKKLLAYVYDNISYPSIALENGIQGTVTVQFVVTKEGKVSDVNVVRGIGGGCDAMAAKVVNAMNQMSEKWTPGKQNGRLVNVRYTLPIKFKQL